MPARKSRRPVLVVVDQSIGQVRRRSTDARAPVVALDLYPHVLESLHGLQRAGAEVVLLAPVDETRPAKLTLGGERPYPVVALKPDLAASLAAAERALGAPLDGALLAASDRVLRGQASARGLTPLAHVASAAWALRGEPTRYVRLRGPIEVMRRVRECIPCLIDHAGEAALALVLASPAGIADALGAGLDVQVLQADPAVEDLRLVRLDGAAPGRKALDGPRIVYGDKVQLCVALSPDTRGDDHAGPHGAHGHNTAVSPNPLLFAPPPPPMTESRWAARLRSWKASDLAIKAIDISHLDLDLRIWSCPATAAQLEADVRRYTGGSDPGGGPIRSRHIDHADNSRVVDMLVADLEAMGYVPQKFAFSHGGRTLHNVVAELPGRGLFRVSPDWRERLWEVLLKWPPWPPEPDPPWRRALEGVLPPDLWKELAPLPVDALRPKLETVFAFDAAPVGWGAPLAGIGAQLVLLGCHLDSTAASDGVYNPATDDAPGVDDNASGIAATLAIARSLAGRARDFRHTIRFCFFNAEEQGMVGSRAYSAHLKAHGAPVRAVICSDMIGFESDGTRIFEIHAGYSDAAVRDISVPIAESIADWAASLGRPGPAQVYKGTQSSGGPDRNLVDGAIGRSDHVAFHEQGYPAVVVSGDFFVNLPSEPHADPNPNYHRSSDTTMNFGYAADIACAIAHAVKDLAL